MCIKYSAAAAIAAVEIVDAVCFASSNVAAAAAAAAFVADSSSFVDADESVVVAGVLCVPD